MKQARRPANGMRPNRMQMEGKWDQVKGQLKEMWGKLTDDDIRRAEGRSDRLVGIIKERTGERQEDIEEKLDGIAVRRVEKVER